MNVVYRPSGKFRYEFQEEKEVPVWYADIYRTISSTGSISL
jgi:hypothetical protein